MLCNTVTHSRDDETIEINGRRIRINRTDRGSNSKLTRPKKRMITPPSVHNLQLEVSEGSWDQYCVEHFDYGAIELKDDEKYRDRGEFQEKQHNEFEEAIKNGGEIHNIAKWYFLSIKDSFPSRRCVDCEVPLLVLPLCQVGYGDIEDMKSKDGKYSVVLYKVAAVCRNYPNCKFPLYRATYSKFWIRSAWFDDRRNYHSTKRKRDPQIEQEMALGKKRKL